MPRGASCALLGARCRPTAPALAVSGAAGCGRAQHRCAGPLLHVYTVCCSHSILPCHPLASPAEDGMMSMALLDKIIWVDEGTGQVSGGRPATNRLSCSCATLARHVNKASWAAADCGRPPAQHWPLLIITHRSACPVLTPTAQCLNAYATPYYTQVRVQAGCRVQQVADALKPHGLTLQNYASIREQQIGGFTQVRARARCVCCAWQSTRSTAVVQLWPVPCCNAPPLVSCPWEISFTPMANFTPQVSAHGTGATIPPVDEQVVALRMVTPGKVRRSVVVFRCCKGAVLAMPQDVTNISRFPLLPATTRRCGGEGEGGEGAAANWWRPGRFRVGFTPPCQVLLRKPTATLTLHTIQ